MRVIIPSIFPFFVVSTYLNGQLSGINLRFLRPVEALCGIPRNSGSVLLLGLLGGYPVGAQCIAQWHENEALSASDAERLLGFCNNAGPAFIFGMLSAYFPSQTYLWALWLVQILSALLTGALLPGRTNSACNQHSAARTTLPQTLERSVRSILLVCGWVILFRIFLTAFSHLPIVARVLLNGFAELTNGCAQLNCIPSIRLRFIVASAFLSFGGLCVHMQTLSAVRGLKLRYYIPGKLLQTTISVGLSFLLFFIRNQRIYSSDAILLLLILPLSAAAVIFFRKNSSFSKADVIQCKKLRW